jgi:hypothetical protein
MRGEVVNINGDFSYRETIYDANKGDAIVMDARFNCQVNNNTSSPPVPPQSVNHPAEPPNGNPESSN